MRNAARKATKTVHDDFFNFSFTDHEHHFVEAGSVVLGPAHPFIGEGQEVVESLLLAVLAQGSELTFQTGNLV